MSRVNVVIQWNFVGAFGSGKSRAEVNYFLSEFRFSPLALFDVVSNCRNVLIN